jgi:hypothetical protein
VSIDIYKEFAIVKGSATAQISQLPSGKITWHLSTNNCFPYLLVYVIQGSQGRGDLVKALRV